MKSHLGMFWKAVAACSAVVLLFSLAIAWCQRAHPYHLVFSSGKWEQGIVQSLAFSSDGTMLASGGNDGSIRLWQVPSGQLKTTLLGHKRTITSLAFLPKDNLLSSASLDGTIRLWNTNTRKEIKSFDAKHQVLCLAVAREGKTLVAGTTVTDIDVTDPGEIIFQDLDSGKTVKLIQYPSGVINTLAYSPKALILASGSGDGRVIFWDPASYKNLRSIQAHDHCVICISFSPNGKKLASTSRDGKIKVWDVITGKERVTLSGHSKMVLSVTFASDETTLVSGSLDGTIRFWNEATGKELRQLKPHSYAAPRVIALSPDGKYLAASLSNGILQVLDVQYLMKNAKD
jgi:WD40 repeat protein